MFNFHIKSLNICHTIARIEQALKEACYNSNKQCTYNHCHVHCRVIFTVTSLQCNKSWLIATKVDASWKQEEQQQTSDQEARDN